MSRKMVPAPDGQKWCPRCKIFQDAQRFGPNGTKPDGKQGYCILCMQEARSKTNKIYKDNNQNRVYDQQFWNQLRVCSDCHESKRFSDFYKNTTSPLGVSHVCKVCDGKRLSVWRGEHVQFLIDKKHSEYLKNIDKMKRQNEIWKLKNPAKVKAIQKRNKARRRLQESLSECKFTTTELEQKIQFYGGVCYLCGMPYDFGVFHMDHVKPLVAGGPNVLSNLRPTHPVCNLKKGGKWINSKRLKELIL